MRFGNLKIGRRMGLVVVVSIIGTLLVGVVDAWRTRDMLLEDRKVKTQHVVEIAHGIIVSYHKLAATMGEAEAQKAALAELATLRYGGQEYFWVNDMTPKMVMHPMKPELNGKELGGMADPNGKHLFVEFVDTVKRSGAGFVDYMWPKPGSDAPVAKISYVQGFEPWGWVVGSGIYLDDVDAIFWRIVMVQGGILLGIVALVGLASMVIARSITRPLANATANMARLAEGDKSIAVDNTDLKSEIGDLARALAVFKQNALEMDRLAAERAEQETRAAADKRQAMLALADLFEQTVRGVVSQVSAASTEMRASAETMANTTQDTSARAGAMSGAADVAFNNTQSVAAATEELSASIREISQQVANSANIANQAVLEAQRTDTTVAGPGRCEPAHRRGGEDDQRDRQPDQSAGAQCHHRGGARRRSRQGLRGGRLRGEEPGQPDREGDRGNLGQIAGMQTATGEAVGAIKAIADIIGRIDQIAADHRRRRGRAGRRDPGDRPQRATGGRRRARRVGQHLRSLALGRRDGPHGGRPAGLGVRAVAPGRADEPGGRQLPGAACVPARVGERAETKPPRDRSLRGFHLWWTQAGSNR